MKLRKLSLETAITIGLLTMLGAYTIVYAAYWIYSDIITVTVEYNLTLEYTLSGSIVALTATLTDFNGLPIANAPIEFYTCTSDGTILTHFATINTGSDGKATTTWTAIDNGVYYFKAGYQVP